MKLPNRLSAAFFAVSILLEPCLGQSSTPVVYTDPGTGITFDTWTVPTSQTAGGLTFGVALPSTALTTDATEFIGYLQCASTDATKTGWCGVSLKGSMTSNLLLMAWPYNGTVLTSFRFSSGYTMPDVYAGNATLTQISSTVNATHYTLLFRCQDCLAWNNNGVTGSAPTSAKQLVLGWAQSVAAPGNPSCPAKITLQQHDAQGIWVAKLDSSAASASYAKWAALANKTVPGDCSGGGGGSGPVGVPVPAGTSFDYVVVGAGAGGIVVADRLSAAGHSVLLIEKGPPSSGRWGGTMKPDWLVGTNLTRFDVPGLCNQIWHDSAGIACDDIDQMAGCVLGGGTAVNAALWWKPNPLDWTYNFPAGWQAEDMVSPTNRVFSRIPWTVHPSADGKIYMQQGYNVIAGGLKAAGWSELTLNDNPSFKNHTYGHTPYMFSHGERGGPMATYLVSASQRSNFKLWTNTTVKRVVRTADGHVTGVEVEPFLDGGYKGVVNVTAKTGRVVLSAGTFGSARILMRSGIGPTDQLNIVKSSSDGPTMIDQSAWINLPVGMNLVDHVNTDTVATHPDIVFYDFYAAYTNPIKSDASSYLNSRIGVLTQSAPNIGPIFFDEIRGTDGITRQIQWTARMEGGHDTPDNHAVTMSQYLGRGSTSRGRMTITANLDTVVSTLPYLRDQHDVDAVIQGIVNLQNALKRVGLNWTYPAPNITAAEFVNTMAITASTRRANHWLGTCKMGTDDGRKGGTAVVDTNTKVYGTDNLFVVDGSIFPGMVSSNPSAYIVVAAERAADRILALATLSARTCNP
ncbi:cellobiose dehydrogenase [Aspergillus udagawae]|uniref:Cellobiose dehydrogenase n=1 Tax=Aspergillus udagawae TaxID=91492 RepID=A0ABQ1B5L0_9EURO|nr:cellobiose dehydrogenase [Aspergillus udagawae]GFG09729.1 cellobiose dehydrogenase [Aspergillus udagawae]